MKLEDFNPSIDNDILNHFNNEANIIYYQEPTVADTVCLSYKQKLYKLVLPKYHGLGFTLVKQDEECLYIRYNKRIYKVEAISSSDWLIINCQNVIDIGDMLFDKFKQICSDCYIGSKRILINKRSRYINVVTNYE